MKLKNLNILDVAKDLLKITKRGNNYFAHCPNHLDKTASLSINPEKNFWKCFSCDNGGGIVELVMHCKRCERTQAMLYLAEKHHIEFNRKVEEYQKKRKELELVGEVFNRALAIARVPEEREYLKKRGLTDEDIRTFQLGTGSQCEKILEAIKNGSCKEFTTQIPLLYEYNGKCLFDKRITFPVEDEYGIANFVGRSIEFNPMIRYMNGKSSVLLKVKETGKCLFNLSNARERISNYNTVVMVEGAFDAMALQKYDNKISVVSTLGCSATEAQIELVLELSNNIIIFYDGDTAGVKASCNLYKRIKEKNLKANVKVVLNPYEFDPEELIFKEKIDECEVVSFFEYVIRNEQIDTDDKPDLVFENLTFENASVIDRALKLTANWLYLDEEIVFENYKKFTKRNNLTFGLTPEIMENEIIKSLIKNENYKKFRRFINPKMFSKDAQSAVKILDDNFLKGRKIVFEEVKEELIKNNLNFYLSDLKVLDTKELIIDYIKVKMQ